MAIATVHRMFGKLMDKVKTVIKKYGDRRLYDSAGSRYVRLEDIAQMIRRGVDVEVVDARSGKDLTRAILTQIVVEDARDRETGLPMQLLRQLVLASDRATHEFLTWYLNGAMELYETARERFSEARHAVMSPLEFMRRLLPGHDAEVEELRRRVEELEARLAEAARPARPATHRRAAGRKRRA